MCLAKAGDQPGQRGVPHQGRRAGLVTPEQRLAGKLLSGRHFREQRLGRRRGGDVEPRQHPAGGALEDLDELGLLDELRDDLDGTGAGADDGDSLAGEVVVVVPAGAVDLVAPIGVQAADVGQLVVGQRAGGQHDGACSEPFAPVRLYRPHAFSVVELSPVTSTPNWILAMQAEVVDHVLDVAADLAGGRVGARPGRVLDERERVQQRRDVASGTGIGVVPPGSADAVGTFEDHDVVDAGLGELDRRAESGETGTDNERVVGVRRHVRPPARG